LTFVGSKPKIIGRYDKQGHTRVCTFLHEKGNQRDVDALIGEPRRSRPHRTSKRELNEMDALVARHLEDNRTTTGSQICPTTRFVGAEAQSRFGDFCRPWKSAITSRRSLLSLYGTT